MIKYYVLVRFMSEKRFVDDFMNGHLFMNYLGYYWDEFHTAEEKVKGQKDFLEGVYCYGNLQKMGFDKEWCDALATDFVFRAKGYRYCDVTCFTRIDYTYEKTPINKGVIFDTDIKMNGFGDYAVIITDQPEFLRRVDAAMKKEGLSYICGNVDYHKLKKNHEDAKFGHHVVLKGQDDIDMTEDIFRNAYEGNFDSFSKTDKYAYQREWRITAYRGVKEECNYILDLGKSMRDIRWKTGRS